MLEVETFRYEYGKPLVKPDHLSLTTMMRRLHEWYMETYNKSRKDTLMLRIKEEHNLVGTNLLPIEFVELFQLYNQAALDKQLMTCYCLFHFILLEIKLDQGVVTILDSRRKDPEDYLDMTTMLQKVWKEFTRIATGLPREL